MTGTHDRIFHIVIFAILHAGRNTDSKVDRLYDYGDDFAEKSMIDARVSSSLPTSFFFYPNF